MKIIKRDGTIQEVKLDKITHRLEQLAYGLNVDPIIITQKVVAQLKDKITSKEIDTLLSETAALQVTVHPDYSKLAARVAVSSLHKETQGFYATMKDLGKAGVLSPKFIKLVRKYGKTLEKTINYDLDYEFDYIGFKTLEKSYLCKINDVIVERPQHLWMRVALAIREEDIENVKLTYKYLSEKYGTHATPTLFNAGTIKEQLASCFLVAMEEDSLEGIYNTLSECAQISKHSGGIGVHIHNIRAKDSPIHGTNGKSDGIVPMLKVFNETAKYVNQSGRRKGSIAIYLEPWHKDIFEFLHLKKNTGGDESSQRARDLFYAMWIPDLFMERVEQDGDWTLFCPNQTEDFSNYYGYEFETKYKSYEALGVGTKVKARAVWAAIVESQIETGGPYILFKDACNSKSNQRNSGVIKSSNLCCVSGSQRVPTQHGMLTVKELYDLGTENTFVGREGIVQGSKMHLPRPQAEIWVINTSDGYTHEVTKDHKVWVVDKGWVEAQDLRAGDKLQLQDRVGLFGNINKPDEALLAGLVAGDGSINDDNRMFRVALWNSSLHFLQEVTDISNRIIKNNNLVLEYKNLYKENGHQVTIHNNIKPKEEVSFTKQNLNNGYKHTLQSVLLFDYFTNLGVTQNTKIKVPDFVWKGSQETTARYLEGVFYTDGSLTKLNKHKVTAYSLSSINKQFLEEIQILLLNFGIKSSIRNSYPKRKNLLPDGKGGLKEYSQQASYRLLVTSKTHCKKLDAIVKLTAHRNIQNDFSSKKALYTIPFTTTFTELTYKGIEDAYCPEVFTEEHSWSCNGLITKNTEILQISNQEETAVCNLASVALPTYVENGVFNFEKLMEVTGHLIENLDLVVDKTIYPVEKAKTSNFKFRPLGLGVMGLADAFIKMGYAFDSSEAKALNLAIFESMYFAAVSKSVELAKTKGTYPAYGESPSARGQLQYHLWGVTPTTKYDWARLEELVKTYGLRNSLLLALMPTASTAQILGCTEAFEPIYSNLYKRKVLSGNFIIANKYLVADLEKLNLWTPAITQKLIAHDGNLENIIEIPVELRNKYKTVWNISNKAIIDLAADRSPYICQSQSMNLFLAKPTFSSVSSMLMYGWKKGLKTGMYYLRTDTASKAQKVTVDEPPEAMVCAIENGPDCMACQ